MLRRALLLYRARRAGEAEAGCERAHNFDLEGGVSLHGLLDLTLDLT